MPVYNLPPPPAQHHRLPSIHSSPVQTPPLPIQHHAHSINVPNGQSHHPSTPNSKSVPELEAKYNRLKRKYFEMEDRMKDERREKEEAYVHLFRMQQERRAMLDRIAELESVPSSRQMSSAFPTMLKPPDLPPSTVSRLRQALDGDDQFEAGRSKPPLHDPPPREQEPVKPQQQPTAEIQFQHVAPTAASGSKRRSRRKAQQPYEQQVSLKEEIPTVVSAGGTRLKIKPPTQPLELAQSRHSSMGPPPIPPSDSHSPANSNQQDSLMADHSNGTSTPQSQARSTPVPSTASAPRAVTQRNTKPKRLKAHTVTAKTCSVPVIPRDPQSGSPILPLTVGIMTVISLGEICPREHFHTERYIFPVGYEVTRRYLSTVDPSAEVTYHCKILEGSGGPIFQIKGPDIDVVEAGSATGAWSGIVKTANGIRSRQHSNSVSGPDYFGLGQNTIKHLIQGLPGANQLRDYVWQKYVEGGPMGGRHAAVVPAIFDDNEDGQAKSPMSDSMDVDGAVEEQEIVPDSLEGGDASSVLQEREEDGSIPQTAARSRSKSETTSVHSPPARSIPSSMASLLNSYPDEKDEQSSSRRLTETSDPNASARSSSFKTVSVARDILGRPLLPLEIPRAALIKLGEISTKEGYHTSQSIYPIGYEFNKVWMSSVNPKTDVNYDCQILEDSEGPVFQVTPEDHPEDSVRKADPNEAWAPFLEGAASIRKQASALSEKGEEFFGLTNGTIRQLIEELPQARELPKYEWRELMDIDGS